jgi:hypothetical protein
MPVHGFSFDIVGESKYQRHLKRTAGNGGEGGVEHAKRYRENLKKNDVSLRPRSCAALIVGGWDRGGDDRGSYGVRLDLSTMDDAP